MLIDVTRAINRSISGKLPTGIDRVCLAYLDNYTGQCQGVVWTCGRYRLLSTKNTQWLCKQLHRDAGRWALFIGLGIRLIKDYSDSPIAGDVVLHLGHSGLENEQLGAWVHKHGLKLFTMIHDLIPLTHPQFTRKGAALLHEKRVRNMLLWSTGILANSQFTLDSLRDYARDQGLKLPSGVSAHLSPADLRSPAAKGANFPTNYFVMLGTIEARKNHALILKVWRKLIDRIGTNTPKLVIIGQRGWACDDVFHQLDCDLILKPHVIELNRCSDNELSPWLTNARALLFPSFIEGYGIPLVEAITLGTPVIASDLPVFHEIAGDIPKYLNPYDVAGWVDAILDFLDPDSELWQTKKIALKQYKAPTWPEHFRQMNSLIAQTIN